MVWCHHNNVLIHVLAISTVRVTTNADEDREAVSYRGLFTAGWFGVRKKHCSRLEIYDRLRASERADGGDGG